MPLSRRWPQRRAWRRTDIRAAPGATTCGSVRPSEKDTIGRERRHIAECVGVVLPYCFGGAVDLRPFRREADAPTHTTRRTCHGAERAVVGAVAPPFTKRPCRVPYSDSIHMSACSPGAPSTTRPRLVGAHPLVGFGNIDMELNVISVLSRRRPLCQCEHSCRCRPSRGRRKR